MRALLLPLRSGALATVLLAAGLGGAPAQAAETQWTITLSGPGAGSGQATVTIDDERNAVCYDLTVTLNPPANAAHIHRGAAGASGPVVVPFDAPSGGSASGCREDVDPALVREILDNPAGFYVNVHNPQFPAGALRGQLAE